MRASEFIPEGQEYWEKLETPEITKARDQMRFPATAVDDFGRVITPGNNIKPPPPKPLVFTNTNKPDPAAGYPADWSKGYPSHITPKMIEPISGVVRLGPEKFVQPGTEEFAQLKQQVDPKTGRISYFRKSPYPNFSPEHEKRLQKFDQELTDKFKPSADKGKEVTWPSRRDKTYNMVDPFREKYRT